MEKDNNWDRPDKIKVKDETRVGLINRAKVTKILFGIISISILISIFIIIMAIWDYIGTDFAYKAVATLGTIIGGGILFSWANDYFGGLKD